MKQRLTSELFFQAVMVAPPKILGRELKPFSLSHSFLLRNLGVPVIGCNPETVRRDDLATAIWICSHTHAQNMEIMNNHPALASLMEGWGRKVGEFNTLTVARHFGTYIRDYTEHPERWESEKKPPRPVAAPLEMHMVAALLKNHISQNLNEAWDMGYNHAYAWYAVIAEAAGDDSLVTDTQVNLINQANEET